MDTIFKSLKNRYQIRKFESETYQEFCLALDRNLTHEASNILLMLVLYQIVTISYYIDLKNPDSTNTTIYLHLIVVIIALGLRCVAMRVFSLKNLRYSIKFFVSIICIITVNNNNMNSRDSDSFFLLLCLLIPVMLNFAQFPVQQTVCTVIILATFFIKISMSNDLEHSVTSLFMPTCISLFFLSAMLIRYFFLFLTRETIDLFAKAAHSKKIFDNLGELQFTWCTSILPESYVKDTSFKFKLPIVIARPKEAKMGLLKIEGMSCFLAKSKPDFVVQYIDKILGIIDNFAQSCYVKHLGLTGPFIQFQVSIDKETTYSNNDSSFQDKTTEINEYEKHLFNLTDFAVAVCKLFDKLNQTVEENNHLEIQAGVKTVYAQNCIVGVARFNYDVFCLNWHKFQILISKAVHGYVAIENELVDYLVDDFIILNRPLTRRIARSDQYRSSLDTPGFQYLDAFRSFCSVDSKIELAVKDLKSLLKSQNFSYKEEELHIHQKTKTSDHFHDFLYEMDRIAKDFAEESTYLESVMRNPTFMKIYKTNEVFESFSCKFIDRRLEACYQQESDLQSLRSTMTNPLNLRYFVDAILSAVLMIFMVFLEFMFHSGVKQSFMWFEVTTQFILALFLSPVIVYSLLVDIRSLPQGILRSITKILQTSKARKCSIALLLSVPLFLRTFRIFILSELDTISRDFRSISLSCAYSLSFISLNIKIRIIVISLRIFLLSVGLFKIFTLVPHFNLELLSIIKFFSPVIMFYYIEYRLTHILQIKLRNWFIANKHFEAVSLSLKTKFREVEGSYNLYLPSFARTIFRSRMNPYVGASENGAMAMIQISNFDELFIKYTEDSPDGFVNIMHALYCMFDSILDSSSVMPVQKIRCSGRNYIVAVGLDPAHKDHHKKFILFKLIKWCHHLINVYSLQSQKCTLLDQAGIRFKVVITHGEMIMGILSEKTPTFTIISKNWDELMSLSRVAKDFRLTTNGKVANIMKGYFDLLPLTNGYFVLGRQLKEGSKKSGLLFNRKQD